MTSTRYLSLYSIHPTLTIHDAYSSKKKRIIPRHLQLAIRNDDEYVFHSCCFYQLADSDSRLHKLLGNVVISQGGVVPHIQPQLLPTKSKGKKEDLSMEVT